MPHVTVNNLSIYYEEEGDQGRPPILFIPGIGGTGARWGSVIKQIASKHRTIAVDPRDAGKSGHAVAPYAVAEMAEDIAGLIMHLRLKCATIAGFSMGGAIAQELAINHPQHVGKLVLVATYDAGDPRGTYIFQQFANAKRLMPKEDYYRLLLPWMYTHSEFEGAIDPEKVVREMAAAPEGSAEAYGRQMQATTTFRSRERLHKITAPTLLIFGDEDLWTPMRFAHSLHQGIKHSRLTVLGGTGHGLLQTRSAELAALISAFAAE